MAKTNHPWVRATKGCRSIRALAQLIKDRIRDDQPSLDTLANYIREPRLAWFEERPAYVTVLTSLTGLPSHVLLRSDGKKVAFTPLRAAEFDATEEDPADLLVETPLMWLDEGGVSVAEVSSGCGRGIWTHVIDRRRRAAIREVSSVVELEAESSREPALVLVERVDFGAESESLARLARSGRKIVVLARRVELVGDNTIAGLVLRKWQFVADWRERITRFLCGRLSAKARGALLAEKAISLLRETDSAMVSVATPEDVVELLAVLHANPKRWAALFLAGDDESSGGALSELLHLRGFTGKRARQLERELRAALEARATRLDLPLHGPLSEEGWRGLGIRDVDEPVSSGLLRRRGALICVFPEIVARNEGRRRLGALIDADAGWGRLCVDASRRTEIDLLLANMTAGELEEPIRKALALAPGALERVGRLDALFAEVGRRFVKRQLGRRVELVEDEALLSSLHQEATASWAHRYGGDGGVLCPVTRPAFYGSSEERSAFIAVSWAWSFATERVAHDQEKFRGHFPGWERLSWTQLPDWWSQIDVRGSGAADENDGEEQRWADEALFYLADRIEEDLEGAPPLSAKIPPILLVPVANRLAPGSTAARDLFEYTWPGREVAKRQPVVAWRLALRTFGVSLGYQWLENVDAPKIREDEAKAIVDELDSDMLSSVNPEKLPGILRGPILWRWSADAKMQFRLGEALGAVVEQRLASASELALVVHIAATQPAWLGEALLRALWKGQPERAFELLSEALGGNAAEVERLAMTAPPREREGVFDALKGRPLTPVLKSWLRRSIVDAPPSADRAWELLSNDAAGTQAAAL